MRSLGLLFLLAAMVSSCGPEQAADAVVLDEFSVRLPAIDASTEELAIRNDGEFPHTLVISDALGNVVVATGAIGSGDTATLPLDLAPGRYEFSCRIVIGTEDGGISDHFELGMVAGIDIET